MCGKRTEENTEELIKDFASRCNDGNPPGLFTTDDYSCYKEAFTINTSFVERQNGTDRHLNARKSRKMLEFSGVSGSSDPERVS